MFRVEKRVDCVCLFFEVVLRAIWTAICLRVKNILRAPFFVPESLDPPYHVLVILIIPALRMGAIWFTRLMIDHA